MKEELGNTIDCLAKINVKEIISCGVSYDFYMNQERRIHIPTENFLKLFPIHDAIDRGDDQYPIELFIIIKGVKVYCITNQEELDSINNGGENV